jgi:hypothetical protein
MIRIFWCVDRAAISYVLHEREYISLQGEHLVDEHQWPTFIRRSAAVDVKPPGTCTKTA